MAEFDNICLHHGCAEFMRGTDKWCPLADDVRRETGGYPFPAKCRKIYNRLHNIEPEEGEETDE